jgi:hypothetical protein
MGAHPEALGPEGGDGLVEDLAAAAHDGDLRAVASELGGDLEADAGSPAGDQRRVALEHVRSERRLHHLGSDLARAGLAVPEPSGSRMGKGTEGALCSWRLRPVSARPVYNTPHQCPQSHTTVHGTATTTALIFSLVFSEHMPRKPNRPRPSRWCDDGISGDRRQRAFVAAVAPYPFARRP